MGAPLQQALILIVQTVFQLYLMLVLLRFLLQVAKADFYNPLSQFIVKATNPLVVPLRRIIPGFAGFDIASLVLALVVYMIGVTLIGLILGGLIPILNILIYSVIGVANLIIYIYFGALIINVIASWVAPGSYHPALVLVNQILEPLMAPIRRLIPPMGGIDISPIFVFLLLRVLQIFLPATPLGF